ncbi:ligand-binding sensor domain-containing protein [Pyxidicoccus xibeiensis]|uniref:hypothetical protein n=1 Tax=Pyxidicoccus xibeiensis TaxID=2906759 RepID=UPI0020A7EDF1|nr:hypothetical protein [Pyxidicoccus xibeiensis]MCP3138977.1 hypothetical protein [Pyxidicoccus xibeiensis]
MKRGWGWAGALFVAGAMWTAGCSSESSADESERGNPGLDDPTPQPPEGPGGPQVNPPVDPVPDSGTVDPVPDGGTQEPPPDGGPQEPPPPPPPPLPPPPPSGPKVEIPPLPTTAGWAFYGVEQGGPKVVYGVTADEGGNVWVAGGEEGLFLLKPGAERFKRYGLEDGLRPYGFMPDGSAPAGAKYLKVISVSGGKAGTVYVGYEGMPGTGADHCESNWDGPRPDPARYKSGDADKVTLLTDGAINVVHYDIFSGPNVVRDELRGREKICSILRIKYDKNTNSVWFGANHGFARGEAEFKGAPMCNGQLNCSGVLEHVHPHINALNAAGNTVLLTDAYYGVGLDPSGDVWFGGSDRSTRFKYGTNGGNFWRAQTGTENDASNKLDLWPDAKPEYSKPNERVPDHVSGVAVAGDGTVWVSSFSNGLARLDASGNVVGRLGAGSGLVDKYLSALSLDPLDGSVWTGASWGGGISRVKGGSITNYSLNEFGRQYGMLRISDIQADTSTGKRRMLVAFMGSLDPKTNVQTTGAIGIYSGD